MQSSFHHPQDVFAVMAQLRSAGTPAALVIVADIWGGSLRAKGAVMAVTNDKVYGYISNGCVDGDIALQARSALETGESRTVRYGEGSPFKDITLPCGGAIDLLIIPGPKPETIEDVHINLSARRTVDFSAVGFTHTYRPKLRIRVSGRGAAALALCRQSLQAGFDVVYQTPDTGIVLNGKGEVEHLTDPRNAPKDRDDPFTAVVLMFHDHDWEPNLLTGALKGSAFYIGAMGSVRTHQTRVDRLTSLGVTAEECARIHAPIGMVPAMRDANLLALSILAEVVQKAQVRNRL